MTNIRVRLAALVGGLLLSATAYADRLEFQGLITPGLPVSVVGPNKPVAESSAGEGIFTFGNRTLTAFCVELEQNGLPNGQSAEYTSTPFTNDSLTLQRLNTLYDRFIVTSRASAAGTTAFQLAVWEIVYDTGASPLSTATGAFTVKQDGTNAQALALTNSWLNTVNTAPASAQSWIFSRLSNPLHQDFITGSATDPAVDAAGTLAMLGIGFGALGWIQRRSRRRVH